MTRSNGLSSDERKKGRLIPEGELPCIWMEAGIVSYKLCSYEHECEACPFDSEMRTTGAMPRGPASEVPPGKEGIEHYPGSPRLPKGAPEVMRECLYHSGHTWVLLLADQKARQGRVRIGVDSFAATVLPRVKDAILPHLGRAIHQGQVFCWIACGSSTLPILAPISGEVVAVNSKLRVRPSLLNADPHGEGWIISVDPSDFEREMKTLLTGEVAASWMASERKKFWRLASLLKWPINPSMERYSGPDVGITLADGGEWLKELSETDSVSEYFGFIAKFFI